MPKTTAPIIFLLGTSTAGKSTICEEIVSKDLDNFETWGVDKEFNNEVNRCREILKDDARFLAIEEKFPHVWKIFAGIHLNEIKDATTGELLNFGDENFDQKLSDFLDKTDGRYSEDALKNLKILATENPNNFREKADLTDEGRRVRAFNGAIEHAIENSKKGKTTILDMVPDSAGGDLVADFKEYLKSKDFVCPTHIALVHLPVENLVERMDQRNAKALAEGGNPDDQRNGIFPFQQYATIFGSSAKSKNSLGILHLSDVMEAVNKFGGASEEEKNLVRANLLERLGFEGDQNSITIGAKVKADAIYDSSSIESTAEIAEAIYGWVADQKAIEAMGENNFAKKFAGKGKAREAEDVPWANRVASVRLESRDDLGR